MKAVGKWLMILGIVILSINLLCRFTDAAKSKNHIQVTGTVSMIQETSELVRAGKRTVNSYTYTVWIRFQPEGWLAEDIVVEEHLYDIFSEGDTVTVLYPADAIYKAYSARKDWMTGAYLPTSNNYDIPMVIAIVLFVLGILCYEKPKVMGEIISAITN